jgi:L-lysine 6-transaminase
MKTAFDWKMRKSLAAGHGERGSQILHFERAFHGRSGYTLSVTNTDPAKTRYFPKFDWPRIPAPVRTFSNSETESAEVERAEADAVRAIERAFDERPHEIAAILIEPVQCEGGDRHFRMEFLRTLRKIADEREALLIFDEVQTGLAATGKWWAHEHSGVRPDALSFAKKLQVGGVLAGKRIDEVDNVFRVPSRISSTWGGALVDMVRATRVLEIIVADNLMENAKARGAELLAGLTELGQRYPELSAARGLGLLVAFDLPSGEHRTRFLARAYAERLLLLSAGERTVRLRPHLAVRSEDIADALRRIGVALGQSRS